MEPSQSAPSQRALSAGERMRMLRLRLGITTRDMESLSRRIAMDEGNDEYVVSHARLTQIENGVSPPSLFKLYSLSAIYGIAISELMSYYVDPEGCLRHHLALNLARTHLTTFDKADPQSKMEFPIRFDPGFTAEKTNLVARMVEVWGEVPAGLLQQLKLRKFRYGFVGLADYTMYPLLRPGSFVQIDERQRALPHLPSRTEFDRPIYFIELRDGYLCSWCEQQRNKLILIPHPLSGCRTQEFTYPGEAEIIGRVTAVAARLVPVPGSAVVPDPADSTSPKQS
jgi:transcriptional regulator with XRE-family HTH domain